ncbi:MAG: glutathione S-transferase family protein [Labilithrix sp.]|nr:glutathione S-transferase family protein [Labilithrix sp.]
MSRESTLVTLVFSHYNEKARWALDYCGVPYRERGYMPGFSQLGVLFATRGRGGRADRVSSRLSTPVLLTGDSETLCDSTDIARWASARSARSAGGGPGPLFPTPEVVELVESFGRDLGPYTRRVGYWHAFQSETALRTLADENVSRRQALAFRALAPVGRAWIARRLGVTEERCRRATDRVRAEMAKVEARLDRGPYLVGEEFTAADLTFASLLAPALLVTREEGYGATFPAVDELGPEARDLVAETRATRAGRFALEMFRRHRRAPRARPNAGEIAASGADRLVDR